MQNTKNNTENVRIFGTMPTPMRVKRTWRYTVQGGPVGCCYQKIAIFAARTTGYIVTIRIMKNPYL